jgi:predicted transcriptional regulator
MDRPFPTVAVEASLDEAFGLLAGGSPAALAVRSGRPAGVITKLDLLEFLAHRQA